MGVMEMRRWQIDKGTHTAINMHAQDFEIGTTIGFATAAGTANATLQIGSDGKVVSNCKPMDIGA